MGKQYKHQIPDLATIFKNSLAQSEERNRKRKRMVISTPSFFNLQTDPMYLRQESEELDDRDDEARITLPLFRGHRD